MAEPKEEPVAAAPVPSPIPQAPEIAAPVQADQTAALPAAPAVPDPPLAAGAEPVAKPEAVPASEPTLLESFDAEKAKPVELEPGEKPAEAKPAAVEAKPGEKPAEPALAAVDYFKDVKIPETIKVDDTQRADVTKALDSIRSGKSVEGVQQLFTLHEKTMKAYAEQLQRDQWAAFNETRKGWRTEVMADPVLGGAGHNTAMGAIARMRDLAVPEADRKDFETFLRVTGAGDHPAFLKVMHNFARYFDEPPLPPEGARPPPNPGRPAGESRRSRMYPSMQNGTGG